MFAYHDGVMAADGVTLDQAAAAVPTPFYCYSAESLHERADAFAQAFHARGIKTYFAIKACSNQAIVTLFGRRGFGADIVSGGELKRALAAGMPADRIVFSGVGKSAAELALALDARIHQFNVESEPELRLLANIAREKGMTCDAALRVNPDVEAGAHDKISTGRSHDKFGVAMADAHQLFAAARGTAVRLCGLTTHIGSQIVDTAPFREAYRKVGRLAGSLGAAGFTIDRLDLGGGYGVTYDGEAPPSPEAFARVLADEFVGFPGEVGVEPGRALVANACVLVTRVLYVKQAGTRRFVIVDAGMNDLIRPSLYEAWHTIVPVKQRAGSDVTQPCDIVGPVCETGDRFAVDRPLPPVSAGDLLAIMSAGAYGASMSSTYNTRPLIPEVMLANGRLDIIRRRMEAEALMSYETVPAWLA